MAKSTCGKRLSLMHNYMRIIVSVTVFAKVSVVTCGVLVHEQQTYITL